MQRDLSCWVYYSSVLVVLLGQDAYHQPVFSRPLGLGCVLKTLFCMGKHLCELTLLRS